MKQFSLFLNLHDIQCLSLNTKKWYIFLLQNIFQTAIAHIKNDPFIFIIYQVMRISSGTCIKLKLEN